MTKITDNIWIGNSHDAVNADLREPGINAILNCAHDLQGTRGWNDGVEYAQCGLADGPGNEMAACHAAVLKLVALIRAGKKVLVHCHKGESRSVFVAICALELTHSRQGWDHWRAIIREKRPTPDNTPHEAHRSAFNKMNWALLSSAIEG